MFGPYSETHGDRDFAKMRTTPAFFQAAGGDRFLFVTGTTKAAADSTKSVAPGLVRLRIVAVDAPYLAVDGTASSIAFVNPGSPVITSAGGDGGLVWVLDENAPRSASLLGSGARRPVLYAIDATTLEPIWRSPPGLLDVGGKYATPVVAHGFVFAGNRPGSGVRGSTVTRPIDCAARAAGWLAVGCLALAAGSVLVFAAGTLCNRLPEYVEGQVPSTPHVCAITSGSTSIRWSAATTTVPCPRATTWSTFPSGPGSSIPSSGRCCPGARAIDLCAWYGMLASIVWRSPPDNRKIAGLAVAFSASCFALVSYAASARPDAVPVVLAGIALWRATRDGRVDWLGGVLLALAAWTKPNVAGIALGLLGWPLLTGQRRDWSGLAGALATSAALAILLQVVSSGEWLHHLVVWIDQPRTFSHLAGQLMGVARLSWSRSPRRCTGARETGVIPRCASRFRRCLRA